MLGSLETEVLGALRRLKKAPARDVRLRLQEQGIDVAYTTVATTLSRLWSKSLVRRHRETCQGGERYVYEYTDKLERRYFAAVLRGVVELFGPSGVVHLNEEIEKLQPREEPELRRRLGLG
jgi:predicted transcriptional regulator